MPRLSTSHPPPAHQAAALGLGGMAAFGGGGGGLNGLGAASALGRMMQPNVALGAFVCVC